MHAILNSPVTKLLTFATPVAAVARALPYENRRNFDTETFDPIEAIHLRAKAMTPLLKEILEFRPSPDWGLND